MVLIFILTLSVSIAGMVAILVLKRYEISTGALFFASVRPRLGGFFSRLSFATVRTIPLMARENRRRAAEMGGILLRYALAQAARGVEYGLEKILHVVREKTAIERTPGEASPFLREVSDHKRQLVREDAHDYAE